MQERIILTIILGFTIGIFFAKYPLDVCAHGKTAVCQASNSPTPQPTTPVVPTISCTPTPVPATPTSIPLAVVLTITPTPTPEINTVVTAAGVVSSAGSSASTQVPQAAPDTGRGK